MSKDKAGERPWEAKVDEIDKKEFEEARRCLLNSYHSYVQTHAGYMIAITIGFLALISSFDSFFKNGPVIATLSISTSVPLTFRLGFFMFFILILSILLASLYMILRIEYWTCFASGSLSLSLDYVIRFFNYDNFLAWIRGGSPYFTEAPYTSILQAAIYQHVRITNPRILITAERYQGLENWVRRTRRKEIDPLINKAKEDICAEQWTKANDNLEIAKEIASSLNYKAKKEEIEKLQKEMPSENVPSIS